MVKFHLEHGQHRKLLLMRVVAHIVIAAVVVYTYTLLGWLLSSSARTLHVFTISGFLLKDTTSAFAIFMYLFTLAAANSSVSLPLLFYLFFPLPPSLSLTYGSVISTAARL